MNQKNYNQKARKAIAKVLGRKNLPANIVLDHIVPRWAGGTNQLPNLQLLTKRQHLIKTAYENAIKARIKK